MTEHRCRPGEGYDGIAAALARAVPGDTIRLAPGRYEGAETLRLGPGVTLSGTGAVLVHYGLGPAVEARGVADVAVEGLSIRFRAENVPIRLVPEAAAYTTGEASVVEWGVVWFDAVTAGRIEDVAIEAARSSHGICLRGGEGLHVVGCTITGSAGSGLWLVGCRAAAIKRNRCYGSILSGITLASSYAPEISENECWENKSSGIALMRNPKSSAAPSEAALRRNRCHGNAHSGITLESAHAPEIAENECWKNKSSGIALIRDRNSSDFPSEATLRRNRCHENAHYGITLQSAHAPEIAENECWQNQNAGIALLRHYESSDAPSKAVLRRNRCHGNTHSGIILESAQAPEIAENECWGNQGSGIALTRDRKSPDAPSEATLRRNRCHDNAFSGIDIVSAYAPEIAENECWGNQNSGISLTRDFKSPDAPSKAALSRNRCHCNALSGITIASAHAPEIADNECWGNQNAGLGLTMSLSAEASAVISAPANDLFDNRFAVIATHGTVPPPDLDRTRAWGNREVPTWATQPDDSTLTLTAPLTVAFSPGTADLGTSAAHLTAAGLSGSDQLARFVDGPGCLHCLNAWWPSEPTLDAATDANHIDGRYICSAEPQRLRFRREASGDGTAAIWAELDRLAGGLGRDGSERRAETARLALVTADESVIDDLPGQIAAMRRSQATKDDPSAALPDPVRRIILNLRFSRIGVAEPVMIDHLPRSQAAMTDADDLPPMFDDALLRGRSRELAALRVLGTSPKMWLSVVGLPLALLGGAYALGAPGETPLWGDPQAAIARAVDSQIGDFELFDVYGLPAAALALLVTVLSFFLALLPPALRPRLPNVIQKRLPTSTGADSGAWRRWARQRVFEREIGVVVIRDAQEWGPRDMADLRLLMELRPAERGLLVVLHAPKRSQMDRAVLRPLVERPDADEPDLTALEGLRLAVGRPPEPLDINDPAEPVPLGLLIGVAAQDAARLQSRKRNIRNGAWSPSDILPMLVMGSTPDLPMSLSRPVSELASEFVPPMEATLLPWVRLFEGDPAATLRLEGERDLLRTITEEEATASRAVHLVVRRGGDADTLDLVGQPGRRAVLLSALREIFADDAERKDYLLRLLACGMLQAIEVATAAARRAETDRDLATLLRALRAAGQLDGEIEAMGGLGEVRRAMLEAASAPLSEAVAALRVPRTREARRLAGLVACRADGMGLLLVAPVLDGGADPQTPAGILAERVSTATALWGKLDRRIARTTIARYLNFELKEADADLRTSIEERLADGERNATTLSDLIWTTPDLDGLLKLLEAHAPLGGQRAAILALQLAGAVDLDVKLAAAQAVTVLRSAGILWTQPPRGSQRRVPHGDEDILRLAQLIQDPRIIALLGDDGETRHDDDPFLDVELGYFDPAHVEVERRIEIVLED